MTTTISIDQLRQALAATNAKHGYRLIFRSGPDQQGRWTHFTLRSEKSGIRGASVSFRGRNSVAASWHAHGHLIDQILSTWPDATVRTCRATYDVNNRGWIDYNIGSQFCRLQASEASVF